jgi:hypothetical protein
MDSLTSYFWVIHLKIVVIIALLCCASLSFNVMAADHASSQLGMSSLKQSTSVPSESPNAISKDITILQQDSGINISTMNLTLVGSPTFGSAQTVKFTAPKPGWKLMNVLVMATDGWNASSGQLPTSLPFAIEIRDADLRLLYHFSDTQLPYFTSNQGIRMASIEVPDVPINGDFFVSFYGYGSLGLAAELQNATGNSYLFDKVTGQLYSYGLPLKNNQTLPINWLIRTVGS